jgi:hypothetical protein
MKHLKKFENKTIDDILDKITSSGVDSLSKYEKEYLDKKSRKESTDDIKIEPKSTKWKKYSDKIGPYDAVFEITNIDEEESIINGILIVNGIEYEGYIEYIDDDYKTSFFYNDDSDVYTDLDGLEYEIDSFFQNAFYDYIN